MILVFAFCAGGQQVTQSDECVRSVPEPVVKKGVFPKTSFRLEKNKSFPHEAVGYESVRLGDDLTLTIINSGCENYTLTFRFETGGYARRADETRFWYRKSVELMRAMQKGIRAADLNLISRGTRALSAYAAKRGTLKYGNPIEFGGDEIRDTVVLAGVRKLGGGRHRVEVTFSVGPL